MKGEGVASSLRPLRLQPTLHNLTGTLCVAVEFLGRKKLQLKKKRKKKKGLILHPIRSKKSVLFIQETVQKLQKEKRDKKPQAFLK